MISKPKSLIILSLFCLSAISSPYAQTGIWQPEIMNFPHFIYLYNNAANNEEREGVVREFNRVLEKTGTPITEGEKCYFIYRGEVRESVSVVGFFNNWDPEVGRMARLGRTDIYFSEHSFPVDARLDYKLVKDGEWMLDPENPDTTMGAYGLNSEMRMPKYEPSPWTQKNSEIPSGRIVTEQWESTILSGERTIHIYLPPEFPNDNPYSVLYCLDGSDYLNYGKIDVLADNLIAAGKIRPLVIVMIDPVDRASEYGNNPDFLKMLADEIIPSYSNQYSLSRERRKTGIISESFGGLAAFYAGLRRPDLFGMIAGQSGHFSYDDQWIIEYAHSLNRKHPFQLAYIQVGQFERTIKDYDFVQAASSFRDALRDRGIRVRYMTAPEDHSWAYWRRGLPEILMGFYGVD
ncbi:MAG: hypothetical protein K9N46_14390 [Candidatus Marinimicrobia bacterium]|nr:hypothetical protein [Candidatus Neomarinimicrobiota bacterium]MCF7830042.1 hypothetical protein [Candidatus Neomarinimicrobiota bacterium]MCF7881918.1 hypothetical protein [Candidatus Neomarinimicrobiota bacterium]